MSGEWGYLDGDGKMQDREIWDEALATMDEDETGIRWMQHLRRAISRGETLEDVIRVFGEPPEAARRALDL